MKRTTITRTAAAGIIALSALGGSMAYAAAEANSPASDAAELQQFVAANPSVAKLIADVETKTGGKVTGISHEDMKGAKGMFGVEVTKADGTRSEYIVNPADGSMKVAANDDHNGENENGTENDEGGDENGENESGNN